jgi:hypothetical protein
MEYVYRTLNFAEKKRRVILLAATVLFLCGGTVYSISLGNQLRYPDELQYVTIAQNLVQSRIYSLDGISPTAYRPPIYPFSLALIQMAGGGIFAFRMFNFVLLAATAWLVNEELSRRAPPLTGFLASFLLLGYPVAFYTAGTIYPQILQLTLMTVLIIYGTRPTLRTTDSVILGVLSGLCFLTVPSTVLLIFIMNIYWIATHKNISSTLLPPLIFILLVSAWAWRSTTAMGQFVLVSTNSGVNLLLGNSKYTTPNAGTNVDLSEYAEKASTLIEVERDHYYRNMAVQYILDNPANTLTLFFSKSLNYFNYRNDLAVQTESSTAKDLLMAFTYYPLLLLALARLALAKKIPLTPLETLSTIIYFTNALAGAIFFHRIRLRLPYDSLLFILAASAILYGFRHLHGKYHPDSNTLNTESI